MLDFLNLKKKGVACELCGGIIRNENCTPKSCSHVFHLICMEDWTSNVTETEEYTCPAKNCSSKFVQIVVRQNLNATSSEIINLKEKHQCPICCETIQRPVATPESCNHSFCYICLKEWSRIRHECPLDRGTYELIFLSDKVGGPIIKRVSAPPVKQQAPESPPSHFDTNCEVCQSPDDEAHLLLCDHCDRGFHTYCLPQPLSSIPDGDWFCPDCIRHGIVPTAVRSNENRRSRSRFIDYEAEESDQEANLDTSFDGSSSENQSRELTSRLQRTLEIRAIRRHRGTRLLQDLIASLSDRISSEASARARRRCTQRQRVRNQLASEASARLRTNTDPSQTTLSFEVTSSTDQPVRLRLNLRSNDGTSTAITSNVSTDSRLRPVRNCSSNVVETARRKRLRVLSSSSESESDNQCGMQLRPRKIKRDRPRLVRPRSDDSADANNNNVLPTTSSAHVEGLVSESSGVRSAERIRTDEENSSYPASFQTDSIPEESALDDSTFVLPSRSTGGRKRPKRRTKKRKCTRKTSNIRPKRTVFRRKFTRTQRRVKTQLKKVSMKETVRSPNAGSRPVPSSSKHTLPRLSILGSEPTCSLYLNTDTSKESELTGPEQSNARLQDCYTRPSSSSTYLRDLEANQAATFQLSTRHMQVNPDNSISPIPITKYATICPKVALEKIPSEFSNSFPPTSTPVAFRDDAKVTHLSNVCTTPSTSSPMENGWTPTQIEQARAVLKYHLKRHLEACTIDKDMYRDILKRSFNKILRKSCQKVTNERIAKLANDYVNYCLKYRNFDI